MLDINGIKFNFGKKVIFEDLSISFERGKTYGIVGSNGVGKTTLFRVICGQYKPKGGSISWNDSKMKMSDISFLPTDPYFYPYMNGREYLKIVTSNPDHYKHAVGMCKPLHLNLEQMIDSYSTGMKKKIAFIACHSQNRDVNIYDEPFNGVDLESNEILRQILIKREANKTTLISSHILNMLDDICDEIIYITEGYEISIYQPDQFLELRNRIRKSVHI